MEVGFAEMEAVVKPETAAYLARLQDHFAPLTHPNAMVHTAWRTAAGTRRGAVCAVPCPPPAVAAAHLPLANDLSTRAPAPATLIRGSRALDALDRDGVSPKH